MMRYYDVTVLERDTMRCIQRSAPHTWERCTELRDEYRVDYADHEPLLIIIAPIDWYNP